MRSLPSRFRLVGALLFSLAVVISIPGIYYRSKVHQDDTKKQLTLWTNEEEEPGNDITSKNEDSESVLMDVKSDANLVTQMEPRIAWLMSIGGSGTSYTIANVEALTQISTATNYAEYSGPCQHMDDDGAAGSKGPCFHRLEQYPKTKTVNRSEDSSFYFMTKTHCAAYCMLCSPAQYIITDPSVFEQECRSGVLRLPNETIISYSYQFPVRKVVHLIRDPFDNLVGRWHLFQKKRFKEDGDTTISLFTLDQWCQYLDDRTIQEKSKALHSLPLGFWDRYTDVPCHVEWFRYVQWHNMANFWTSSERRRRQVYHLHYENYTQHYNQTVLQLLAFLGYLEQDSQHPPDLARHKPFITGKSYRELFDASHVKMAAWMVQELSFPPVWKFLQHYFVDDAVPEEKAPASPIPIVNTTWRRQMWPALSEAMEDKNTQP